MKSSKLYKEELITDRQLEFIEYLKRKVGLNLVPTPKDLTKSEASSVIEKLLRTLEPPKPKKAKLKKKPHKLQEAFPGMNGPVRIIKPFDKR